MDFVDVSLDLAKQLSDHPGRLVIYEEGLVAVNLGNEILVSRPGARMGSLERGDLISVQPAPLVHLIEMEQVRRPAEEAALRQCRTDPESPVPGPEIFFVADLLMRSEKRLLAHVQPISVNQILASPRARQFADRRVTLSEVHLCGLSTPLIPYADPGTTLAKEVRTRVALWQDRAQMTPSVIFLQNNGLILMGDTPGQMIETIDKILKASEVFLGSSMMGGPQFLTVAHLGRVMDLRNLETRELTE